MVDRIVRFILENGVYKGTPEYLKERVLKHVEYKTIEILWKNEIIAVCLYNIDGCTCDVLEAVVKKGLERRDLLKIMLFRGLLKFPATKYLKYRRGQKKRKEERILSVYKIFKLKEPNGV